ncbi:MAG TPA: response regulator [Chloroflexota bacterium]|nr:response regulator [Chloroflexota bacterium]
MKTDKRILVVDDSNFMLAVAKICLEKVPGWQVLTASSGEEALTVAETVPDAILLDIVMPGMDGPTTMEKLRASDVTRNIPIVFFTGTEDPDHRQNLAKLGAAGLIPKPFDPLTLTSQVRDALGWKV